MARRDPVGNTNFDDNKRFFVTHACLLGVATNISSLPVASDRSRVASCEHCQLCFFDRASSKKFWALPRAGSQRSAEPAGDRRIHRAAAARDLFDLPRASLASAHLQHRSTGHHRSTDYGRGRYAVPPIAAWRTLGRRALLRIRFGHAIGQRGRAISSPRCTTLAAPLRGKLVGAVPE
jgi:hypothetical protein